MLLCFTATENGAPSTMHDGTLHIYGKARTLSLYVSVVVLMLLTVLSMRAFLGAYQYSRVTGILDDRSSDGSITIMDLSEETISAYLEAVGTLERAIFYDPSRAHYRKALSDIYARIGSWAETMEFMQATLPEGTPRSKVALERAATNIREAIRRQPTNPDNHLSYGHMALDAKSSDITRSEYQKAVNAYPKSSAVRYSVTMEYLAAGMKDDALVQANVLARIDDSYKMPDSYKVQMAVGRRTTFFVQRLSGSYLFRAFEVIWRTSHKDVDRLRDAVPDSDEARDALELFLDAKGIEKQ